MKYKCLVLDHDDTVVRSTPTIHFPSFVESMGILRPEVKPYTLEEFLGYCFEPGFHSLCVDMLGYNKDELKVQRDVWRRHTKKVVPPIYDGFEQIILEFKKSGGYICVVSHSEENRIIRDYLAHFDIEPDIVFGWDEDEDKRKPHPYPLKVIMDKLNLKADELLMVDDLKPGLDMSIAAGVDFACAGWSHFIDSAREYMVEHADFYLYTVGELRELLEL